jgi:hypothetical protein
MSKKDETTEEKMDRLVREMRANAEARLKRLKKLEKEYKDKGKKRG